MFIKRLITAIISILILVVILFANIAVIEVAVGAVIVLCLYEMYRAFGYTKRGVLLILGIIPPVFMALANIFNLPVLLYVYMFILFAALVVFHDEVAFRDIASVFLVSIFVTTFLWHIVSVRKLENGEYLIWAVFLGACMTDTFAYITGSLIGTHKLIPKVSPKKTVEGAIGGILGCVISFLIYGLIMNKAFGFYININALWILGALCAVAAQIGDLTASVIKRECGIKDYGTLFPGHGGMMDRFDSIMFVAPLVYYFVKMLPIIWR
ncbi:MAG: phosphatidate cytidylyltransferase [Clostridia bacterium]|nr:phosphatidate cytidylyltransferase [Clostridia bacterium]